eukprot:gb/GECG01012734.1/.p1 GENE.gb/GECG01012734.1/~~gb/GECG01012734.1/.p1  ORF type:complete len:1676 (+),score=290.80 gb/GECG01012734.1/:1-5028(+)
MEKNKTKKPAPVEAGGTSSSSHQSARTSGSANTKKPSHASTSTSASTATNTAAVKDATSGKNKKNQQQKRKKNSTHHHSSSSSNAKKKQEAEEAAAAAAAEEEERKRQQEEEEKKETIAAAEHHIQQLHMIAASRQKQWKSMDPDNVTKIRSKAKSQMKSDVKKSLALVKRIGSMSTSLDKIQSLLKDIATINLSRYSSEIAVALIDPRMRSADVPVVAGIAGAMHQRYPGFLPTMLKHLFDSLKTCLGVMLSSSSSSSSSGNQTGSSSISTENSSILQQASEVLKQAKSRVEKIANKENDIDTLAADDLGMGLGDLGDMGMGAGASLSGSAKRSSSSAKDHGSGDGKSGEMTPKAAQTRCRVLLILLSELYLCGIWRDEQTLMDILNALVSDQEFNPTPTHNQEDGGPQTDTPTNGAAAEVVEAGNVIRTDEGVATEDSGEKSLSSVFMDAVETRTVSVDSVPKRSYRRAAVILPLVVPVLKHVSYGHLIDFDNYTNSGDSTGRAGTSSGAIPLSQYLLGRFPQQYRSYLSQLPVDILIKWPFVGYNNLQPYMQDLEMIYGDTPVDTERHLVFSCVSTNSQNNLCEVLFGLFYRASAALQAEYSNVCRLEKKNREIEFNRGDVPEKAAQNLSNSKQYFEKLSNAVASLRDSVDCVAPSLQEPEPDVQSAEQGEITLWDGSWEGAVSLGPFDDEAMRSFYLDVSNLRDTIPSILLDTPEEAAAKAAEREQRSKQSNISSSSNAASASTVTKSSEPSLAETAAKFKNPKGQRGTLDTALKQFVPGSKDSSANQVVGTGISQGSPKPTAESSHGKEFHRPRSTTDGSDSSDNEEAEEDNQEMLEEDFMQDDKLGDDDEVRGQLARTESVEDASFEDEAGWGSKESFDRLLQELSHCVSKDLIDNWAHEFVVQKHFNKLGRRLLLKHIAYANPAATDMFPYYARLVAIFEKASPGFSRPLLATLEDDLKYMTKKKRNSHLDLKLRNGRLAAELCKFGIAPPNMIFRLLSRCIRDFSSHSIELLATILEGCGKYLYMLSQTRERVQQVLDTMQKLKKAKGLDGLRASLLDNAYYACVPVTGNNKPKRKERPMLYEFLRYLILEKLGKISTNEIVKAIRRLPWSTEPMVSQWFRKAVFRSIQTSSATGSRLVSVLSSLKAFRESVVMHILDHAMAIIEDGLLVSNMENFRYTQKRMAVCHFIGDAYNVKLVDNKMLLRLLYAVINTGHALPRPSDAINSIRAFAASEEIRKKQGTNANITIEDLHDVDLSSVFPHPLVEPDPRVPQMGTWGFHPLVPCETDKKEDVHRIHIVCEILQNCATPISKGAARQKIDDFLCCFERYILSKGRLPVETDTFVSETLDLIRPDRKRFTNFQEAQLTCAKLELAQCKELAEQAYNTRYKTQTGSTNVEEEEDLNEAESSDDEEVDAEGDQTQENASSPGDDTETSEHELEDEDLEREREPKHKSEADMDFESQLAELEKESIEQRKLAGSRVTAEHMTLPLHLKQKQDENRQHSQNHTPAEGRVAFTLLRRKGASRTGAQNVGTKIETRTLYVPENVPLAARSSDALEAARREKEELKRVTLAMQDRQEVEERKQTSSESTHASRKRTGFHRGEELEDVPETEEEEAMEAEEQEGVATATYTRGRGSRGSHHRGRGGRGGRGRGSGGRGGGRGRGFK